MHASVDGYLCIVCECVSKPKSMRNLFLDIAESMIMFGLLVNYESTKLSRLNDCFLTTKYENDIC